MSRSRSETESDEAEEESSPGVLDEKMATALAITDDQWFDSLEATEKDYILQNPIDPISTDLKCTSCSSRPRLNFQKFFVRHPILGVPICKDCRNFFFSGRWLKDEDGFYESCLWCGNGGNLMMCSKEGCCDVYCRECLKKNIGRAFVTMVVESDDWNCLECDPKPIWVMRSTYFYISKFRRNNDGKYGSSSKMVTTASVNSVDPNDVIAKSYDDARKVSKIFNEFFEEEADVHAIRTKGQPGISNDPAYVWKKSRRIAKLINVTFRNLDKVFDRMVSHLGDKFPTFDIGELRSLAYKDDDKVDNLLKDRILTVEHVEVGAAGAANPDNDVEERGVGERHDNDVEERDVGKRHDNDVNDETAAAHDDNDVKMKDGDDEQNDPDEHVASKVTRKGSAIKTENLDDEEITDSDEAAVISLNSKSPKVENNVNEEDTISNSQTLENSADDDDDESDVSITPLKKENCDKSLKKCKDIKREESDVNQPDVLPLTPRDTCQEWRSPTDGAARASSGQNAKEFKIFGKKRLASNVIGIVAPTKDALSQMELENEKAKLEVLMSSSSSDDSDSETEDNRSKSKTGNKFEDDAGIFSDESLKEMLSESGTFNDMKSDTLDDDDDDASDAESSTNDVVSRSDDKKSQISSNSSTETDPKLKDGACRVQIERLSYHARFDLERYGRLNLFEHPDLQKLVTSKKCQSTYDPVKAEIERLCDLKSVEKFSQQTENSKPKNSKELSAQVKGKKMALGELSSDSESDDNNQSDLEKETSSKSRFDVDNENGAKHLFNANELAKKNVLESSSSDDNDDEDDDDDDQEADAKSKKETKNGEKKEKERSLPGNEAAKKKKWADDPSFMKVKLSDDSDVEEEKARKRLKNRKKVVKGDESDVGVTPKKNRRRAKVFDVDSDVEEVVSSDTDHQKDDDESSDSDVVVTKKTSKRKKKASSNASDVSSSDDEPRPKKKRRRIKKNNDSSEEDDDEDSSPTKGRHNIRKIIKDTDLSATTKAADREERDRRKRMEERQKLYNKTFELSGHTTLTELPLDFDPQTKTVLVEVDKALVKHFKPHQGGGVKFLWDAVFESKKDVLEDKVPGGAILAHCMGLGKTLQTIGLVHTVMKNFPKQVRTVLVLCPVNTIKNWVEEFDKWLPDELKDDIIEVHDSSIAKEHWDRAYRLQHWIKNGGIMVMGYDMYRNLTTGKKLKQKQQAICQRSLVDPGPDLIICDEGHILKNTASALNIAINKIQTRRRIILTGTPLQNNLSEYFAMVDFVKPQLLGSYKEFKNRFVNPIQNGQHSDSTDRDVRVMKKRSFILCDLLKGCMQRLDYSVLTPYLQPKHEYVLCLCLTELQKKLYTFYLENYARAGQIGDEGKMEGGRKGGLFYDVQNLSRIWNHPFTLAMAKEKADSKRLNDDDDEEIDEAGSLKDFVVDESDDSTPASSSNDNSDIETLNDGDKKPGKKKWMTRGDRQKMGDGAAELLGGLDEVKCEDTAKSRGWWAKFMPEEDSDDFLLRVEHGAKMILLMEILKECEILGDKVLVFSQSLLSLDLIETFLKEVNDQHGPVAEGNFGTWIPGQDYFRMDGSTPPESRKKWCNFFNKKTNHRTRLFLISTKAGGLGINLVSANRVIIFDASWNPANDIQSIFRVYRFGQQKPVYIYRFLAKGTMEEKIYDRQVTKQSLSARVVDEQQIERHFSMNELAELYQFNDEPLSQRPLPNVPKDRLLAELLNKHQEMIWKYHDHDSLLENQVDENLTEEERKSAWEEFENEKQGINSLVGNPAISNLQSFNFNPNEIAEQYKLQYPHLTEDQVIQATRAYIMQVQSAYTRKPAYDKSHYQQEMARARGIQQQMYPGMFRHNQSTSSNGGQSSSAKGADMLEVKREAMRLQQMQMHAKIQHHQQQLLHQQRLLSASSSKAASAQASDDDDVVVLDGSAVFQDYAPARPSGSGLSSRRGRPRLDPDSDPLV